jgi:hypothetical protein
MLSAGVHHPIREGVGKTGNWHTAAAVISLDRQSAGMGSRLPVGQVLYRALRFLQIPNSGPMVLDEAYGLMLDRIYGLRTPWN